MKQIEIDDEVYDALVERCEPLVDTANDVLRRLLDLPRSSERVGGVRRTGRGTSRLALRDLFAQGWLKKGQVLEWHRPRLGVVHRARVTDTGAMRLETGQVVHSPSTACKALTSTTQNGWNVWQTRDGTTLWDLRQQVAGG